MTLGGSIAMLFLPVGLLGLVGSVPDPIPSDTQVLMVREPRVSEVIRVFRDAGADVSPLSDGSSCAVFV